MIAPIEKAHSSGPNRLYVLYLMNGTILISQQGIRHDVSFREGFFP